MAAVTVDRHARSASRHPQKGMRERLGPPLSAGLMGANNLGWTATVTLLTPSLMSCRRATNSAADGAFTGAQQG
jgi:hypothetical protein